MSQERLQQAHKLIKMGNYDDAYVILQKIDDPLAKEWLKRIDSIQRTKAAQADTASVITPSSPAEQQAILTPQHAFDDLKGGKSRNLGALKALSSFYYALAIFVVIFGVLAGVMTLRSPFAGGAGIGIIIISVITGFILLSTSQIISGFIELVENSRQQTKLLQSMTQIMLRNSK